MREVEIDLAGRTPQKLTDELARGADMLITMGCGQCRPQADPARAFRLERRQERVDGVGVRSAGVEQQHLRHVSPRQRAGDDPDAPELLDVLADERARTAAGVDWSPRSEAARRSPVGRLRTAPPALRRLRHRREGQPQAQDRQLSGRRRRQPCGAAGAAFALLSGMRTNRWSSRVRLPVALSTLLLGLTGRPASAADSSWTTTLRVQVPASQLALWKPTQYYSGWVPVGGVSVSERFGRLFEAELGATYALNVCSSGWNESVRGGVNPEVLRTRPEGAHWSLRVPALASYGHTLLQGSSCDGLVDKALHTLTFDTGFDVTYWTKGRWGFNMRLLAGVGHAWEDNRLGGYHLSGLALEGALAFGVSF